MGAFRTQKRVQTKLGKTHVDYWRSKLRKRSFVGRDGNPAEVPDWQVRIKHQGRYAWFNLKSANAAIAADLAKEIYVFLIANGWEATLEKYKPQVEKRAKLKVQEFADLYREQIELVEYPPIPRTINRYVGCLFLICKFMGIKRIARLTADKISAFRRKYLKKALEKKRDETSAKITCNSQMRGAAALFSEKMIKAYKAVGVDVINPFTGYQFRRIEIQPCMPLPREFLDGLWRDSAKLRDGDPDAPPPPKRQRRRRRKPIDGRRLRPLKRTDVRWAVPDWRRPHPESYTLMLLELGVGLRREEADKAEWSWFFTNKDGRHYIEVKKTKYFTPKGKKRRIIPVENVLWDAIHATVVSGRVVRATLYRTLVGPFLQLLSGVTSRSGGLPGTTSAIVEAFSINSRDCLQGGLLSRSVLVRVQPWQPFCGRQADISWLHLSRKQGP